MKVRAKVWVEIALEVEGEYVREVPETGPTYSSGGEPGEPAHFEDVTVVGIGTERAVWDLSASHTVVEQIEIDLGTTYFANDIRSRLERVFADQIQQALLDEVTS